MSTEKKLKVSLGTIGTMNLISFLVFMSTAKTFPSIESGAALTGWMCFMGLTIYAWMKYWKVSRQS